MNLPNERCVVAKNGWKIAGVAPADLGRVCITVNSAAGSTSQLLMPSEARELAGYLLQCVAAEPWQRRENRNWALSQAAVWATYNGEKVE